MAGGGSHLSKTTFSNNFAPILLDKENGKFASKYSIKKSETIF
jgi:hypothetical protein